MSVVDLVTGEERELEDGDHIRLNGRDFYLTRGKVVAVPREPKKPPVPPPAPAAKSNPSKPAEKPAPAPAKPAHVYKPEVMSSEGSFGPSLARRIAVWLFDCWIVALREARRFWLGFSLSLDLKRLLKPALAAVALVLLAFYFRLPTPSPAGRERVAQVPAPERELVAKGRLSPKQDLVARREPASAREIAAEQGLLPKDLPAAPPEPGADLQRPSKEYPAFAVPKDTQPPVAKPQESRITFSARAEVSDSGRSKVVMQKSFEVVAILPDDDRQTRFDKEMPADQVRGAFESMNRGRAPTARGPALVPIRVGSTSDDLDTTVFDAYVPAGMVVDAHTTMNRERRAPAQAKSGRFDAPTIERSGQSHRLDWCLTWRHACGKPAADAFCRQMNRVEATAFQMDTNLVETAYVGQNDACPGAHPDHSCSGFAYIDCR